MRNHGRTNAVHRTAVHPRFESERGWLLTLEAALAAKRGKRATAKALLQTLGNQVEPEVFEYMGMSRLDPKDLLEFKQQDE